MVLFIELDFRFQIFFNRFILCNLQVEIIPTKVNPSLNDTKQDNYTGIVFERKRQHTNKLKKKQ